jgi:hypothetical protein
VWALERWRGLRRAELGQLGLSEIEFGAQLVDALTKAREFRVGERSSVKQRQGLQAQGLGQLFHLTLKCTDLGLQPTNLAPALQLAQSIPYALKGRSDLPLLIQF